MSQKDRGLTPEEIDRETRKLASDLSFIARAPVSIQLVGGNHIAFTFNTDEHKKQHQVPIVMNPETLKKVRNKEQAIKIWRGIGYHELAHHLFPAGPQYKAAEKEGFRHLFNLVDDEQNERKGRSMDEEWGSCFQSVCAHVFPSKNRNSDTLSPGIIDGEKEGKKPRGIAASKVYGQRWNQFAFHLRRHISDPPDPVVAEAIALIPKRFMDLTKDELLELTRQIHLTLSKGIELPKEDPEQKPVEPEEKEDEDKEPEEQPEDTPQEDNKDEEENKEEEEENEEDGPEKKASWNIKKLFKSKLMLIPFLLFVLGWSLLLLRGGVNFWLQVAITGAIALAAITAFLFIRRAFIKALLRSIAARVTPVRARAGPRPATPPRPNWLQRFVRTKVAAVIAVLLILGVAGAIAIVLGKFIGFTLVGLGAEVLLIALAVFIASKLKKRARRENTEIGKFGAATIIVGCLLGLAALVWTLGSMGMGFSWLGLIGGVLGLAILVALSIFLGSQAQNNMDAGYYDERMTFRQRVWRHTRVRAENIGSMLGGLVKSFFRFLGHCIAQFFRWIFSGIRWFFVRLARFAVWVWGYIVRMARFIKRVVTRTYWFLEPYFKRGWKHWAFRLAVIALPVAIILVILYAVLYTAGHISPWLLAALILLLLLLLLLGILFRKQIKKFVVTELFVPMPSLMDVSMQVPLDMETEWFVQVDNVVPVEPDQEFLDKVMPAVHVLAQQLRPYLKRCGKQVVDREDQPDGYDLTDEAELALVGETSVFVNDDTVPKPSVHLEVALDCSGSMSSPTVSLKPGEKFLLGKFFALVLEQASLNLPGVSAHFWGFTDSTIFDCGTPGEGKISGLQIGGGNNDAAMLWHMGQSASQSGKDVKLLLMLSDGQPSECSWLSLKNLVLQFEQEGMIPWNFALDVIQIPAFERFFTDLVGQSMEEAIVTMGETLATIAQEGV